MRINWTEDSGAVAIVFAVASTVIFGATGAAVDYNRLITERGRLQAIADAAALAGVRTLLSDGVPVPDSAVDAAREVTAEHVAGHNQTAVQSIDVIPAEYKVRVGLTSEEPLFFGYFLNASYSEVGVVAEAVARRKSKVCLFAMSSTAEPGILLQGSADIDASECAVWANSTVDESVEIQGSGTVLVEQFCTVGGIDRKGSYSIDAAPESGCKPRMDPFESVQAPADTGCDHHNFETDDKNGHHVLQPGVYCGGLTMNVGTISLDPGTYVLKDGPLVMRGNNQIEGTGVTFVLTGSDARMDIAGTPILDISAPDSGPYENMVIVRDRNAPPSDPSEVTGNGTLSFSGHIYLPGQAFRLWGNGLGMDLAGRLGGIFAETLEFGGDPELTFSGAKVPPKLSDFDILLVR